MTVETEPILELPVAGKESSVSSVDACKKSLQRARSTSSMGRTCFAEDMPITPRAHSFEELLERELAGQQYNQTVLKQSSYEHRPLWEEQESIDRIVVVERHLPDEHPSLVGNPYDLSEDVESNSSLHSSLPSPHPPPESQQPEVPETSLMEEAIEEQVNHMKLEHRASWTTLKHQEMQDLEEFKEMEKAIIGSNIHPDTQQADSLQVSMSLEKQAIQEEHEASLTQLDPQDWEAISSPISKHPKNMSTLFSEYDTADLSYAIQDTSRVEQLNASSFFISLDDGDVDHGLSSAPKDSALSVEAKESLLAKIVLLENTINNLKKDLAIKDKALTHSSQTHHSKLFKEREAFEQYRVNEISKIEEMKQEEMKKLRKERVAWEKQKKAADILPNKRERQELELLRSQISELIEEHKKKENRLVLAQDRLKKKVEALTNRNHELEEEVKVLEVSRAKFIEEKHVLQNKIVSMQSNETQNSKLKRSTSCAPVGGLVGQIPSQPVAKKQTSMPSLKVEPTIIEPVATETKLDSRHPSFEPLNQLETTLELPHHYQERVLNDGKTERMYPQGTRLVWYKNGTTKEFHADGSFVIRFLNGDYKKVDAQQTFIYWFAETNTLQTAYADGLVVYQFESGQIEKSYPDGTLEILFPDGTFKLVHPNGQEESTFPDGTVQKVDCNGQRTIEFADGTKEYFLKGLKKRVHPDGTIKIVYPDGLQETRYVDGRIRVKDAQGIILREA